MYVNGYFSGMYKNPLNQLGVNLFNRTDIL